MSVNIRKGVHHTNSSSVHAIAIHTSHMNAAPLEPDYSDDLIHVSLDEFFWGFNKFDDLYTKLSYLLTMVKMTEYKTKYMHEVGPDWQGEIDRDVFTNTYGFYLIDTAIYSYCGYHISVDDPGGCGSIDHQSCEGFVSLTDFLDFWCIDLHKFLFDTAYELWISDDNGGRLPTDEEINTFENKHWYNAGSHTLLNLTYYKGYGVDMCDESDSCDLSQSEHKFLDESTVGNCTDDGKES